MIAFTQCSPACYVHDLYSTSLLIDHLDLTQQGITGWEVVLNGLDCCFALWILKFSTM